MQTYFIYGITDCPACLRACASLMEAGLEYVFVETDFAKSYRTHLKKQYRRSTFSNHYTPQRRQYRLRNLNNRRL